MNRPDPKELFALYHLGLDREGRYKFRNLAEVAKIYGVDNRQVLVWLQDDGTDPDTVKQVDYNLTKWHVEAQFVPPEGAADLIRTAWEGYQTARKSGKGSGQFHHDVDYDDIWGDHRGEGLDER